MTGDQHRDEPDRPLEGLGTFAWKLSLATIVACVGVAVVLLARGDRTATRHAASEAEAGSGPSARAVTKSDPPEDAAQSPIGREVDRRHGAGELAEARRTFEPCRGGDVRRLAWIDAQQRVRKLVQVRATGLVLAQWFDDTGAVREAVVHGTTGGRPWTRRVLVDDHGREERQDTPAGAAPDEPPPSIFRGDPSSAFFAGPGCER